MPNLYDLTADLATMREDIRTLVRQSSHLPVRISPEFCFEVQQGIYAVRRGLDALEAVTKTLTIEPEDQQLNG